MHHPVLFSAETCAKHSLVHTCSPLSCCLHPLFVLHPSHSSKPFTPLAAHLPQSHMLPLHCRQIVKYVGKQYAVLARARQILAPTLRACTSPPGILPIPLQSWHCGTPNTALLKAHKVCKQHVPAFISYHGEAIKMRYKCIKNLNRLFTALEGRSKGSSKGVQQVRWCEQQRKRKTNHPTENATCRPRGKYLGGQVVMVNQLRSTRGCSRLVSIQEGREWVGRQWQEEGQEQTQTRASFHPQPQGASAVAARPCVARRGSRAFDGGGTRAQAQYCNACGTVLGRGREGAAGHTGQRCIIQQAGARHQLRAAAGFPQSGHLASSGGRAAQQPLHLVLGLSLQAGGRQQG